MTEDMPALPNEVRPSCSICNGAGTVQVTILSGANGSRQDTERCTACGGTGQAG
ncbi:hypothetical protein [Streptomyces xiamenensis]|uniref:hypothetical protein n=1 Tax=Streptomyces xiamenensis TaxID=408015 RepID=UPI0035DCA839